MNRYQRNRIYIGDTEQAAIKHFRILIAGAGLGSVIAECLLRMGFETLTIIDGDKVEESNLNRQNYTNNDIGKYKVDALRDSLLSINPNANVEVYPVFLTRANMVDFIVGHHAAVNALDFASDAPFVFDDICQLSKIKILHPYNLGWAALVYVAGEANQELSEFYQTNNNEIDIVNFFLKKTEEKGNSVDWLRLVVERYKNETESFSPPQLSTGSYLVAALCSKVLFNIVCGKGIKYFPEYYYLSTITRN